MRGIAIYGAGGFGREVAPLARETLERQGGDPDCLIFVSDHEQQGSRVNGLPVVSFETLVQEYPEYDVVIALADHRTRIALAQKCSDAGLGFATITASTHLNRGHSQVGVGAIWCDHTVLLPNTVIGSHFHCNVSSYIAHDCIIGHFVTLAPRVCINGRVKIEDCVYVGTGAIIRDGKLDRPLTIGAGAMIGMGAVVTKDVPAGTVVIGNPARPLITSSGS